MAELILDLQGPFVVQFKQGTAGASGVVYVYAPRCDNHHANVLTDSDDVFVPGNGDSPKGKYIYRFIDKTSPKGVPKYQFVDGNDENLLLIVPFQCAPLDGDQCHLMLELPCPDLVIPLHPERIWVHKNTARNCWVTRQDRPDIVDSNRARGLRFIYKVCQNMPAFDVPEISKSFCSDALGASKTPHYSMTLHFANAGPRSAGQADAYSCFHNARSMWSADATGCDFSDWRVDYDELEHFNQEGGGPHPRDCGSAMIIMQDWK